MGWVKHNFEIKKIVDGKEKESISHEIDHVKVFDSGTFALEIEWNNKDPFYDRDLENFKRLHPAYASLTKQGMLEGLTAPIHPGALRYYKQAGLAGDIPAEPVGE